MVRSLMVLGILAVVAFMAGWFSINRDGDRTTIEINRDEIRNDAGQAIDRGKEYWEQRRLQQAQQQQGQGAAPANGYSQTSPWGNPPSTYPPNAYQTQNTYDPARPNYPPANQNGAPGYQQPTNTNGAPAANPWGNPAPANWQNPPAGYQNPPAGYPAGAYDPAAQPANAAWPPASNSSR